MTRDTGVTNYCSQYSHVELKIRKPILVTLKQESIFARHHNFFTFNETI